MKKLFLSAFVLIGFTILSLGQNPGATATATATATVRKALSIVKAGDLSFGSFTVENAGNVSVGLDDVITIEGGAELSGYPAASAVFNLSGDNDAQFALTLPSTPVVLSDGDNHTMTIATESWLTTLGSSTDLSGALSSAGKLTVNVGATLAFVAGQTVGSYSGEFDITVAYE